MITLIIDQVILILLSVLSARWHAHSSTKRWYLSVGYMIAVTMFCWLSGYWLLMPTAFFIRKLTFDPFVNHFRRDPINYMSVKPVSILDQFDRALFGRDWLKIMLAYFIALTVSEYFLLNHYA